MIVFLKLIFTVSYIWKLGESRYHSFTGFLAEIVISIEYSEDMLLENKMIVTPLEILREIPRDHWWQIEMVLLGEYYLYQYKPLGYIFACCLFQVRVFGSFTETVRIYDAQFLHPIIFPLQTKPLHSKVSVTIYETIYNHGQNILRKIAQSVHSPPPPPLFFPPFQYCWRGFTCVPMT